MRWLRAAILGLFLSVILAPAIVERAAYAQAGLDKIEQKVQDVSDLVSKVLVVVVVVGSPASSGPAPLVATGHAAQLAVRWYRLEGL